VVEWKEEQQQQLLPMKLIFCSNNKTLALVMISLNVHTSWICKKLSEVQRQTAATQVAQIRWWNERKEQQQQLFPRRLFFCSNTKTLTLVMISLLTG
jgi:hypothetical protein